MKSVPSPSISIVCDDPQQCKTQAAHCLYNAGKCLKQLGYTINEGFIDFTWLMLGYAHGKKSDIILNKLTPGDVVVLGLDWTLYGSKLSEAFDTVLKAIKTSKRAILIVYNVPEESRINWKSFRTLGANFAYRNLKLFFNVKLENRAIDKFFKKIASKMQKGGVCVIAANPLQKRHLGAIWSLERALADYPLVLFTEEQRLQIQQKSIQANFKEGLGMQKCDKIMCVCGFLHSYKNIEVAVRALIHLPNNYSLLILAEVVLGAVYKDKLSPIHPQTRNLFNIIETISAEYAVEMLLRSHKIKQPQFLECMEAIKKWADLMSKKEKMDQSISYTGSQSCIEKLQFIKSLPTTFLTKKARIKPEEIAAANKNKWWEKAGFPTEEFLSLQQVFKDRIRWGSTTSYADMGEKIAACDAVIIPDMATYKNTSTSLTLAAEFGKRIFVSYTPLFVELEKYWKGCFTFFDLGNELELAAKILRADNDQAMIDENLATARKRYNVEGLAQMCHQFIQGQRS